MKTWRYFIFSVFYAIMLGWLAYFVSRTDVLQTILLLQIMFIPYLVLLKRANEKQLQWTFWGMRVVLLFALPELSDDYFRFIWDGRLTGEGENPFLHLPSYYVEKGLHPHVLTRELYDPMNSKGYFSIYPPLCQAIFYVSTFIGKSTLASVIIMRIFIVAAEVGTVYFGKRILHYFGKQTKNIYIYALNPLIIVELTGNLHFEGIMLFFLIMALCLLLTDRWLLASIFFGFSVSTKLLPLMILPLLIVPFGFWRSFKFGAIGILTVVVLFLPFMNEELISNVKSSVDLYFLKFEFNASIYYILNGIGTMIKGYNIIGTLGKILPIVVFSGIILLAFGQKKDLARQNLFGNIMFAFLIYFALASIVHPWYVSTLILMACFSRFRFPVIWSLTVVYSYSAYGNPEFNENLWLIGTEYILVALALFWELRSKDNQVLNIEVFDPSQQK